MDSILTSLKKLLGIPEEYENFDADLIIHINSVFSILTQLGVGPSEGFYIKDKTSTWNDFVSSDYKKFEMIKSYVYLKVKLLFDPPTSSPLMESNNRLISELEWRLNVESDSYNQKEVET